MRIAIVNDLVIATEALRRVVSSVPEYTVIWQARDGAEAVARAIADPPDLILMDLLMPEMDGVEATRRIMQQAPCAILLVTATVEGLGSKVFEAMGYGALDAVNTPVLGFHGQTESGAELLAKIHIIGKLIGKTLRQPPPQAATIDRPSTPDVPVIVIGSSTGGPEALKTIFAPLPQNFPAAIVVIQHIDAQFAPGFADWLQQQTTLTVKLAQPGQPLCAGSIFIAGRNKHLVMTAQHTLAYTAQPSHYIYQPSIDVFFDSMAQHWPQAGLAILLTGMGKDGANGLLTLRSRGWRTIAQDQASCVVYGMPKAAIDLGAATEVRSIDTIASVCLQYVQQARSADTR